jgi:hypothetical protein
VNKFYKQSINIFTLISFFYLNEIRLEAIQAAAPTYVETPSIPSKQITSLDLTYVYGGDFILGQPFDEEELIQKVLSSPNLEELNLSGQSISPSLMTIIRENLPNLKKISIKGSVRFNNGDGLYYSWESINQQIVSVEMLQALFLNESPIEILDLSLSTIDDNGLEQISQNAYNLREIYLEGASGVTDTGIIALLDKLPNLKIIDLSSYTLRMPMANQETIAPQISEELIKVISDRGIIIIQNNRTPWF